MFKFLKIISLVFLGNNKIKNIISFSLTNLYFSVNKKGEFDRYIIVDIDNTLANTWPIISNGKFLNVENLPFFSDMKDLIQSFLLDPSNRVIFCTVRPMSTFFKTKSWLSKIGLQIGFFQLLFVGSPRDKLLLINKLIKSNKKIIYLDDLSYNHEFGEIKFYDNVIESISNLDIIYYGYYKLKEYQHIVVQVS